MLKGVATLALVSVVAVSTAQAQVEIGLGGGVSIPTNDNFKSGFKTGWNGQVSVGFVAKNVPVGFEIDGNFQQNKAKTVNGVTPDVKDQIIDGTANVVYKFKTSESSMFRPYIIGGVGVYNAKAKGNDVPAGTPSSTKFGVNGGAGFDITSKSNVGFFVEGRFHNIFISNANINFVNVDAGVRFKLPTSR
jgi:hypothetical protein